MIPAAERARLLPVLDDLAGAVEDLVLTGLTTASEASRRTLDVSFREASRLGLLRLGSTLRVANEELGRYTRKDPDFSRRRLSFFLNRSWLLSRGLARSIRGKDEEEWNRLAGTPPSEPLKKVEVVTLGVLKRHVPGTFCSFEFRLRSIPDGRPLVWSCVFPMKPGVEIPPEGYLHLPQKQEFKAVAFLEGNRLLLKDVALSGNRITMGEKSRVEAGKPFAKWEDFLEWDPAPARERLADYDPKPLDLEVELQEEVVLRDWAAGEPEEREDGRTVVPVEGGEIVFDATMSKEEAGIKAALVEKRKETPPLYGLVHYERCRLVFQPLTMFGKKGPLHLMISDEKIDRAALLRALRF